METTTLDLALSLHIVLRGVDPPVERTLVMSMQHSLADLHRAIQCAFDGDAGMRHMFSDQEPFPRGYPDSRGYREDACTWTLRQDHYGWRPRRRWGDTWTMIDWRDPNVLSEADATLPSAFEDGGRLHYRCSDPRELGSDAWFSIDAQPVAGAEPSTRVVDGRGRSPLSLVAVDDYRQLLRAYADPRHPEHDDACTRLERASGPWASFDPLAFDTECVQRRLDRDGAPGHVRGSRRTVIDAVTEALPSSNAAGLYRHTHDAGLDEAPAIEPDEAARFTRPFGWLIEHCREGLPLHDGRLRDEVREQWADAGGISLAQTTQLQSLARKLRLVRSLQGRLLTMKAALPFADDPLALWSALAARLLDSDGYQLRLSDALFLLAIADGSITRSGHDGGLDRIARAHDACVHVHETVRCLPQEDDFAFAWPLPPRPVEHITADEIRPLVAPLAERLEPLGLSRLTPDTWLATPLMRDFARAALQVQTTAKLSFAKSHELDF
ncbi:hypothetical protein ET475_05930 [Microbacterium protaetiae]|uniref:Plasmid pRiA4b Orf3-like domain-containing protein n=1 Tax=Microbacterium protaetiae TaxID=2509458 RepID=A0A4P6ENT7_9MICO|nr:hypothetical protein [Microbacterium protaetiae]QAY59568.1 hypothetical protein ET475_05930 [Microbacterium protaetiae]